MNTFTEMSQDEIMNTNGGVVGWIILGGVCLLSGFGVGYGLAYWLG